MALEEQLGDEVGVAKTCNHLAIIASTIGRAIEAEGWFKRTLELDERVHPGSSLHAGHLSNLANLLMNEVRAGCFPENRLIEARSYAERALTIKEKLGVSSGYWITLGLLAKIADIEGHVEEARTYRRREREAYAAFEGNRYHIDQQHGKLIAAIAAAEQGDTQAREAVEAALPQLEEDGWKIATPTRRIWSGERDWDALVEGLGSEEALLILRVLETIAQPAETQGKTPEQMIASLPASIRAAMEQGNQAALQQAFDSLSSEEQQVVVIAMQYLQAQAGEESE